MCLRLRVSGFWTCCTVAIVAQHANHSQELRGAFRGIGGVIGEEEGREETSSAFSTKLQNFTVRAVVLCPEDQLPCELQQLLTMSITEYSSDNQSVFWEGDFIV